MVLLLDLKRIETETTPIILHGGVAGAARNDFVEKGDDKTV